MNQEFLIGEWVERRTDGAIGIVIGVEQYDGEYLFRVRLQRSGDPTLNEVLGTTAAWDHYHRVHAHVVWSSADCDGRYSGGRVEHPVSTERTNQFGDLHFKERLLGDVVSFHRHGTVTVTPDGFTWHCDTDEGHEHTVVEWCEDEGCDDKRWQRDHRAEAMGY